MFKFVILVGVWAVVGVSSYEQGCKIHLSRLPADKAPLYLIRTAPNGPLTFLVPNGGLVLKTGEEVILACPGNRNGFVKQPSLNIATGKCQNNENVEIFGTPHSLREIECLQKITSEVQSTGKSCGKATHKVKNIGFNVPTAGFIPLISICHDVDSKIPIYAVHNVHGTAQSGQQRMNDRPQFLSVAAEIPNINRFYLQSTQPKNFETLLSSKTLAEKYLHSDSFLSRGHLAPVRDFPFNSWKSATFYFINAAPQWYQTNSGNWNEIEYIVRTLGQTYRANLKVITGTLDTLMYPDTNNRPTKMYLNAASKTIQVPKYYWKIVVHPGLKKAISFVSVNNPYEQDARDLQEFCPNVCGQTGFNLPSFGNGTAGYVTCCDVMDLKKKVTTLPFSFDSITGLLKKNL